MYYTDRKGEARAQAKRAEKRRKSAERKAAQETIHRLERHALRAARPSKEIRDTISTFCLLNGYPITYYFRTTIGGDAAFRRISWSLPFERQKQIRNWKWARLSKHIRAIYNSAGVPIPHRYRKNGHPSRGQRGWKNIEHKGKPMPLSTEEMDAMKRSIDRSKSFKLEVSPLKFEPIRPLDILGLLKAS